MGIYSAEKQALASLVSGSERPEERINAARIINLVDESGDQPREVFLKGTVSLPAVDPIGNVTVAVYSTKGSPVEKTGDKPVHDKADFAVLARCPEQGETGEISDVLQARGLSTEVALVFERILPLASGRPGTFEPTNETRAFVPQR
jgi:hypothetical protein